MQQLIAPWGYRPALDGLRALAVYVVVAFHAGSNPANGGFIGVDLFFVLSGFLITMVLLEEQREHGRVRLIRFYGARLRRLVPGAAVAILGTAILMIAVKGTVARSALQDDAQASGLWYANWHFISQATDYFDTDVATSPYLHFWSLSIEEQFYVGYPLLLIGLAVLARRVRRSSVPLTVVVVLAVASLVFGLLIAGTNPTRAYYGTDTRGYQLLSGAALAMGLLWVRDRSVMGSASLRRAASFSLLAALVLFVAASSKVVDFTPQHRGMAATAFVLVMLACTEAAPHGWVTRALAARPIVKLGKLSYGTYLWHWPIIIALQAVFPERRPVVVFMIAASTATAVAALVNRLVEQPIREFSAGRLNRRLILAGLAIAVFATAAAVDVLGIDARPVTVAAPSNSTDTALLPVGQGFELPTITPSLQEILAFSDPSYLPPLCAGELSEIGGSANSPRSANGHCADAGTGEQIVMLIGDSHALEFAPAFELLAIEHDFTFAARIFSACAWQIGLEIVDAQCGPKDEFFSHHMHALQPDLVIVTASSRVWESGSVYKPGVGPYEGLKGTDLFAAATADTLPVFLENADNVLLMDPFPLMLVDPNDCLVTVEDPTDCAVPYADVARYTEPPVYQELAASNQRIATANVDHLICFQEDWCHVMDGDRLMYRDQYHVHASHFVEHRDKLWTAMEPALASLGG